MHAPTHSLQSPFINLPLIFSAIPKQAYSHRRCVARRHDSSFTEKKKAECCTETSVSTRLHVVIVQKAVGFMVNISLPTAFCCYKTHIKVTLYHTRMKCQMFIASDLALWKGDVKVASTSEVRKTATLRF